MKKQIFILFLILFSVYFSNAQSKYSTFLEKNIQKKGIDKEYVIWVFFKDKGTDINKKLQKASLKLSERSIARRKKLMKNKSFYATFYDIPVEESYINTIKPYLIKLRHTSSWLNALSARVKGKDIEKIAKYNFVKYIDLVRTRHYNHTIVKHKTKNNKKSNIKSKHNLDYGASLGQLEQINVPKIHDMGFNGNGIIICLLDAGFNNLEHEVFNNINIIDSYDFVNDDDNVDDEGDMGSGEHGTMTLSTIGGFHEGNLIGPAYGASYLLAKTENTDSETQVEEDNWVAGAQWAEALGAQITSTSLGYIDFDDGTGYDASELDGNTATITIAADAMADLGVLVVNSAGNSGPGATTIGAPADGDNVLAVGAVDSSGNITSFSSMGPTGDGRIKPDVMARGSNVYAAGSSGNSYSYVDGTSFSCPLTAGAAALLWQMVPSASNMEIFNALKMTASNANNPNNEYGWGIIDVYAAYKYFLPNISTTPLGFTEDYNGPYVVTAEVTSISDLNNDYPKLVYRVNGGDWIEVNMVVTKDNTYTASIPGTGVEATYDYYIIAKNEIGTNSVPEDAPVNYYSFKATRAPQVIHQKLSEIYGNFWDQAYITAQIIDNDGIDIENSYVSWKINNDIKPNIPLTHTHDNYYRADFPEASVTTGDIISYKIIAQDASSEHNVASYPNNGYYQFTITDYIGFENNNFIYNWTFGGDNNWGIASDFAQQGNYSAHSGDISNNQKSSLSITFNCDASGYIKFYKKISSEENYDFLNFYLDGVKKESWSGESDWQEISYSVNSGEHTLKWEYEKDYIYSAGVDSAWIDNISLPNGSTSSINVRNLISAKGFPNPAKTSYYLIFDDSVNINVNLSIFDISGKNMLNISNYKSGNLITLNNFENGIYILHLNAENGNHYYQKLIIAK